MKQIELQAIFWCHREGSKIAFSFPRTVEKCGFSCQKKPFKNLFRSKSETKKWGFFPRNISGL